MGREDDIVPTLNRFILTFGVRGGEVRRCLARGLSAVVASVLSLVARASALTRRPLHPMVTASRVLVRRRSAASPAHAERSQLLGRSFACKSRTPVCRAARPAASISTVTEKSAGKENVERLFTRLLQYGHYSVSSVDVLLKALKASAGKDTAPLYTRLIFYLVQLALGCGAAGTPLPVPPNRGAYSSLGLQPHPESRAHWPIPLSTASDRPSAAYAHLHSRACCRDSMR